MDRKSIILLVASFVLMMLWYPMMERIYPPKPLPPSTNRLANASNQGGSNAISSTTAPGRTNSTPAFEQPERLLTVTNAHAIYTFTSHGGGLKLVELLDYRDATACDTKAGSGPIGLATLNNRSLLPTLSLAGGGRPDGDGVYELAATANGVRSSKTLPDGLRIAKEFSIGTNYLLTAKAIIENSSSQPISVPRQEWVAGTATPMGANDTPQMMGTHWYNGSKAQDIGEAWFANRTLGCFPGTPRDYYEDGSGQVGWVSVQNQFFALAVIPSAAAPRVAVRSIGLRPDRNQPLGSATPTNGYQAALVYPAAVLAPGKTIEHDFTIYAGPKEYKTLSRIGFQMNNNLDQVMNYSGFFGFFAKALLLFMNGLASFGMTYGLAIVSITVIIKLVFWPLTTASTRSMKRMQALQPQMKAIQDKYKDDPTKGHQKTMEFMREHKVSPLGGCLPMLLQIPVFIGFYQMIQSAIELRGQSFLWACDLSQPDTVFHIAGFPINPLPLIYGVTLLWSASLMPPSPGMDPAQQKIMKYMPVMFLVILYKMASGLTLYWTVQNLLTIAQTKLTKTGPDPAGKPAGLAPSVAPQKKKRPE